MTAPAPNYTKLNNLSNTIKRQGIIPPGGPAVLNGKIYIDITLLMKRYLNDTFSKSSQIDDLVSDAVKNKILNCKLFKAIIKYLEYNEDDNIILYFTHNNIRYPKGVIYIYDFKDLTPKVIP